MLISALTNYYDSLRRANAPDLPPERKSFVFVPNLAILNRDGELVDLIPNTVQKSYRKKNGEESISDRPKREVFPERIEVSAIRANLLEHRGEYLFGVTPNGKNGKLSPVAAKRKAFCELNLPFFAALSGPMARAFRLFAENWSIDAALNSAALKKALSPFYFCFCLEDDLTKKFNEDDEICARIDEELVRQEREQALACPIGQCAVSGEVGSIVDIHRNLKGIFGAQMSGANIVSVNMTAGESYGLTGGLNASVSRDVMKKYTAAFNYISARPNHSIRLDEMTVLFFSQSGERDDAECDMMLDLVEPADKAQNDLLTENIYEILHQAAAGKEPDFSAFEINENELFYLFGVVPNASRLSVRFVYRNTFGDIARNIIRHHTDMRISGNQKPIGLGKMMFALRSPKSDQSHTRPSLEGDILKAILKGTPYPRAMLTETVYRVRTDRFIDTVRAGMLKAYLNRLARLKNDKEEITMALNKDRTDNAYLCGRLFAVLEKTQKDALGDVNSSIKDKFFSSACARPASVFPRLNKLALAHLKKVDEKRAYFDEKEIREIIDHITEFPVRLDIEEQGSFILGYYQQNTALYTKKEKENGSN